MWLCPYPRASVPAGAPHLRRALRTAGKLWEDGAAARRPALFSLARRVFRWRFGVATDFGGATGVCWLSRTGSVSSGQGGPRGWPGRAGPRDGCNLLVGFSLLPRGCSALFTVGADGSSRRQAEEAEFSLKGHFESSLSELIVRFCPGPDLPVSFGVRWGSFTTTAFSGAVERSPWLRAQPCAAFCFHNNGYKGLKTSLGVEGTPAQFRLCILSNSL